MDLLELVSTIAKLSNTEQDAVYQSALEATKDLVWVPNPGPQTTAYFCEADEVFYGGQAGGGKSDLALGLALTQHSRSLILRKYRDDAKDLGERMLEITSERNGWNGQDLIYRYKGRLIRLAGCSTEEDRQRFKGKPHDLIAFDEVSDFSETQYTFIIGWNRSAVRGQRCRVVSAGNPPTRPEGLWVLKRWGAWLDPQHPRPARPGELRWYTADADGKEIEVDGRGPHIVDGEKVYARSRTFIPGKLSDNPDLAATSYKASLDSLPAELRAAYRDGDFGTALQDDAYQCVPTAWIREAQARWTPQHPVGAPMCAIGVDVAQGGEDNTVLAIRYDGWYAPLVVVPGVQTPSGKEVAGIVVAQRRNDATVVVDLGGGWGGDAYGHLKENQIKCVGYMGVKVSTKRTVDRQLRFFNVRTEAYWRFREALDPSQEQGSSIMLPQDPELVADLCAPTFEIFGNSQGGTIKLESKEHVSKRTGRSPDKGDAVVMAWWDGLKQANVEGGWQARKTKPKVVMGYQSARR